MDEVDPIADLVDWQMSNESRRRPPERSNISNMPPCPNCGSLEWHGLSRSACGGSHLSKEEAQEHQGDSQVFDTPIMQYPYYLPRGIG